MRHKKNKKNIIKKNIELTIDSIGFEGVSVARNEGLVYFVKNAVPGDVVLAEIQRKKRNYVEAKTIEIIKKSESRSEPVCKYFGECGGCNWQNLQYSQQLKWKKQHIEDSFVHIGKLSGFQLEYVLPSPKQYNYRNKMEFSFGTSRWLTNEDATSNADIANKDFALGLHVPERFDKVLNIENCSLQPDTGNRILDLIGRKAVQMGITAYHERNHTGFLRNLIIRSSLHTNEFMTILITTETQSRSEEEFIDWYKYGLNSLFKEISCLVHAVNIANTPVATGEIRHISDSDHITESILGLKFSISPFSFFQTNSFQLERFISKIIELAEIKSSDTVWDLYCGTGSISIPASRISREVVGIELSESSVSDARMNAGLNYINNIRFHSYDLHSKDVSAFFLTQLKPDIIIIDPPRAGMHKNLIDALAATGAKKIIYVSCNPASQARDCAFMQCSYSLRLVQPVDMFPQTYHIESIAVLERGDIQNGIK